MKNITVETAENSPKRISYRKRLNNKNNTIHGYDYYDHHYYSTWKHIFRFILKYVGKNWDTCYSDFLNKFITQERTLIHTKNNLIWQFKDHFANFNNNQFYASLYDFIIDDNGIIQKQDDDAKYRKQRTPLYKEYIYKYAAGHDNYWDYHRKQDFIKLFGEDLLNKAYTGISDEDYEKAIYTGYIKTGKYYSYLFERIPVGEPVTDEERPKVLKEQLSKKKKYKRELDKIFEKFITENYVGKFADGKVRQKEKKQRIIDEQKKEEIKNNIERDRLGFNEESFKTPRKFAKNA